MRLFILLSFCAKAYSLLCPSGYTDVDGNCISTKFSSATRNGAYTRCAQDNAYIRDVPNGFMNTNIMTKGAGSEFIWLGLTCADSSFSSCVWDSGRNITSTSYSNFAGNNPTLDVGSCVAMLVSTGKWYSVDCARSTASYFCESTPNYLVPRCASNSAYFQGKCYYGTTASSLNAAESYCSARCGHVSSIHSPGENSFVRDIAMSVNSVAYYSLIGLQRSGNNYFWVDSSSVNYKKFGYENSALGSCVSMAIVDGEVVNKGNWISTQCSSGTTSVVVCKKDLTNQCDPPVTVPATMSPPICSGTDFQSGYGELYSPGYPYGSQPNSCDYLITEDDYSTAMITFNQIYLDRNSFISLYYSFMDRTPFATITNTQAFPRTYYSIGNSFKIIFNTTGSENFNNYWTATYGPSSSATEDSTSEAYSTDVYYSGCPANGLSGTNNANMNVPQGPCEVLFGPVVNQNYYTSKNTFCLRFEWNIIPSAPISIYEGVVKNSFNRTAYIYPNHWRQISTVSGYRFCTSGGKTLLVDYAYLETPITVFYEPVSLEYISDIPSTVISSTPYTGCYYEMYGSGEFTSPNYPSNYSNNLYCVYRFFSTQTRVILNFSDGMETEFGYDYINIHEGYETDNNYLVYWLSGNTWPKIGVDITSVKNVLTLVFTTDGSIVAKGFAGTFRSAW